jgi:hypothetical protein
MKTVRKYPGFTAMMSGLDDRLVCAICGGRIRAKSLFRLVGKSHRHIACDVAMKRSLAVAGLHACARCDEPTDAIYCSRECEDAARETAL